MVKKHKPAAPNHRPLVRALLKWFPAHARDLPWRRTLDPYAIWVSEIMLQQTQVKTVIPYFERWMKALPDVEALAACPSDQLHKLWEGLGYYTRVRNMQKAAREIVEQHEGNFPTAHPDILALPGIGRYTAGAIASIAFDQPQPIVDGNVIRVLARLFAIGGDPKEKTTSERFWSQATELVELARTSKRKGGIPVAPDALRFSGGCSLLNQALMELGATICTPANPACDRCPVRRH
ncbi:MAG TPA: hypothetical protein DCY13_08435, partial [Verrucomicrobiales bacterium]|nr:hypothetical protein [Verrucomicrobiales bacterium]